MAGLVGYASSDEEEGEVEMKLTSKEEEQEPLAQPSMLEKGHPPETRTTTPADGLRPPLDPRQHPEEVKDGPVLGPSLPTDEDRLVEMDGLELPNLSPSPMPSSPYTANRELLQNLTLPPVPNLDVPPSPPGTPPPGHAALTAKFENFLVLKRTKGTHFNARLAQSAAMRNPALMDKLLGFVGLDDPATALEGTGRDGGGVADQYATVLPPDLWDPAAFPEWAFRGELRKAQEKMQQEREAERASGRRDAVEFVPASSASTPAGGRRKTRFDNDGSH